MGGEVASSPARSPRELAPLEGSPAARAGRGSPGPGSPAREALRRALNGDLEQPNLALAPHCRLSPALLVVNVLVVNVPSLRLSRAEA